MAGTRSSWMDRSITEYSRRDFVEGVGGGLAALSVATLAGCTQSIDRTDDDGNAPMRRCISSLLESDPDGVLETFAAGVQAMKDLDSSDARNWDNVVAVHRNADHNNWHFLPWHRAYLFYFEDIVRDLTGEDRFALPFWNWIENPEVPEIFAEDWNVDGADDVNPLYHDTRWNGAGEIGRDEAVVSDNLIDTIVSNTDFFGFAGTAFGPGDLEFHPHNHVHGQVGGDMNRVTVSPVDPVFWAHHCMVDYLWWDWNANRRNPLPNEGDGDGDGDDVTADATDWLVRTFDDQFVDDVGETVESVSVLETILMPTRSFEFEACPGDEPLVAVTDDLVDFLEMGATIERTLLEQAPVTEELEIHAAEPATVTADIAAEELRPYLSGEEPATVRLGMRGVTPPRRGAFSTLVFVNRPERIEEPTSRDPHFARNLDFFVDESLEHAGDLSVDLTSTLRTLVREDQLDGGEALEFQFASVPYVEGGLDDSFSVDRLTVDVFQTRIDGELPDSRAD